MISLLKTFGTGILNLLLKKLGTRLIFSLNETVDFVLDKSKTKIGGFAWKANVMCDL